MAVPMMDASWSEVFEKQKPRHGLVTTRAQVKGRTSQKQKDSRTRVLGNMATMEHATLIQKGDSRQVARCNGDNSFKHPVKATTTRLSGEQKEGGEEDSVCSYSV